MIYNRPSPDKEKKKGGNKGRGNKGSKTVSRTSRGSGGGGGAAAATDLVPLDMDNDLPEGFKITDEIWDKLQELRQRKFASEQVSKSNTRPFSITP